MKRFIDKVSESIFNLVVGFNDMVRNKPMSVELIDSVLESAKWKLMVDEGLTMDGPPSEKKNNYDVIIVRLVHAIEGSSLKLDGNLSVEEKDQLILDAMEMHSNQEFVERCGFKKETEPSAQFDDSVYESVLIHHGSSGKKNLLPDNPAGGEIKSKSSKLNNQ